MLKQIPDNPHNNQLLLIDKPLGWSSFDVVKKLRRVLGLKKIGHGGTLDPLATGLLIVCTGKQTKTLATYQQLEKTYLCTMRLGGYTATYDGEMPANIHMKATDLTLAKISEAGARLSKNKWQIPPQYAAIKVNGQRAYRAARSGKKIQLKPRHVAVYDLRIIERMGPYVSFQVRCQKGTYIRSIAHDWGTMLGVGAYVCTLRRTAIGPFRVQSAQSPMSYEKRRTL